MQALDNLETFDERLIEMEWRLQDEIAAARARLLLQHVKKYK